MLALMRRQTQLLQNSSASFATTVNRYNPVPKEKDYYQILGVPSTATLEQIKEAYRVAVKRYHPDVKGSEQPDASLFRDVQEAYGILATRESRASYDLARKKNPDDYRQVSESEFNRTSRPDLRGSDGHLPVDAPKPGSYAETRMRELKEQRDMYNVNYLGYYKGGLPQKNRGNLRGEAMAPPDWFHQPDVHNHLNNYFPDSKLVTSQDAIKFKAFMNADKVDFNRTKPGHVMYYDRSLEFSKDRRFWLSLLLCLTGGYYLNRKFYVERNRLRRTERMEGLDNVPAHHVSNHGGVVFKKRFVGFEKYYRNGDDMMRWYRKAYPRVFKSAE